MPDQEPTPEQQQTAKTLRDTMAQIMQHHDQDTETYRALSEIVERSATPSPTEIQDAAALQTAHDAAMTHLLDSVRQALTPE